MLLIKHDDKYYIDGLKDCGLFNTVKEAQAYFNTYIRNIQQAKE